MLVLALTVPVTAFTVFVLARHALDAQSRYAGQAEQIAGFVSQLVDKELSNLAALLRGASNSSALQGGDFELFHREALRLVSGTDHIIVLRDRNQRQLLNTAVPFGTALPAAPPILAEEQAAFDRGATVIGGVYTSPISGELRVPVALPVTIESEPLVLAITVTVDYFHDLLVPAAPPGWVVTLGDGRGIVIARTLDNETYVGTPALPAYLELASGPSGSFRIEGFGGAQLLSGYTRSSFSGWLTGANIPVNVVEAPLWNSLAAMVMVALGAAVIAIAISTAFIRRFRRASQVLLAEATRDKDAAATPPADTGIEEFDQAIDALAAARSRSAEAERSLRDRTQELEVVLETAPAAVWFTYEQSVEHVKSNAHASRMLRMPADSNVSIASGELTHLQVFKDGAPCPMNQLPLDRAFRGEHLRDEEYVFRFDDGTEVTLLTSAEPLRDPNGEITGSVAIGIDISERKRNDEHQKLLINELNHRVKNTLTTVQSIARRSLRTASSLQEAERALGDRLVAVARAYDALTRERWQGSSIRTMIENTVAGYSQVGRVMLDGPDFWLSPSNGVTFSLIVHELAVNATKHGALSGDAGHVEVSWIVEHEPDADVVTLTWRERGGPPVKPPERTGFGSDLLRRLSDSGGSQHRMDFDRSGLTCTFSLRQHRATAPTVAVGSQARSDQHQ
jgi:two-component sensor histidine kinase